MIKPTLRNGTQVLYSGKARIRSAVNKQILSAEIVNAARLVLRNTDPFSMMPSHTAPDATVNVPSSLPLLFHTDLICDLHYLSAAHSSDETRYFERAGLYVNGCFCPIRYVFDFGSLYIPCVFSNYLTPIYASGASSVECLHHGYNAQNATADVYQSFMFGKGGVDIFKSLDNGSEIQDEGAIARIETAAMVAY